ncbi:hypothetical protein MMC07_004870 [Pseudocyphellaria aurata]|nr:hypothetical protein [Pseudocyphellaria aurata]
MKKTGPIIRINPDEVHIYDPEFYDTLYSQKSRYSKIERLRYRFGMPTSTFDTTEHDHHTRRRAALGSFFSKQKVADFSFYIQQNADRVCHRLQNEYSGRGKVVSLNEAWGAFVADDISYYAFGFSYDFLGLPDFIAPFTSSIRKLALSLHIAAHFPWFVALMQSLSERVVAIINPDMIPVFEFHGEIRSQIKKVMSGENDANKNASQRTVFHEMLNSKLPPHELTLDRLHHEAASILGGGIDTTKTALTVASFFILSNPDVERRLRQELMEAIPDASVKPKLAELEALPYLNAVVQEGKQSSTSAHRIDPVNPIHYPGTATTPSYTIPPNTIFGMTSYLNLTDPSVFPSPNTFDPSRWLGDALAPSGKPLSRYMTVFGRGPRMCLGMNFAIASIYIGLATVFRHVEFELYETDRDAIDMAAQYFSPVPKAGTKGTRVTVK